MKKVTKYEATDGTLFDTEAEALRREHLNTLSEWYRRNPLHGSRGESRVGWGDFLDWLSNHRVQVQQILNRLP